jgi:G3E family GTPase
VVELNGTADPIPLLEAFTLLEQKLPFAPRLQVAVVDARHWARRGIYSGLETLQVETASHFHVSHADEMSVKRLAGIAKAIRALNPHAVRVTAGELAGCLSSRARLESVSAHDRRGHDGRHEGGHRHSHGHEMSHAFTGCQIRIAHPVSEESVLLWLDALPENVLRAKAIVRLREAPDSYWLFERVRDRVMPGPDQVPMYERIKPSAVLIGPGVSLATMHALASRHLGSENVILHS